jgi:5-methyltetrahydropteroyltriglutamate--homocysteine methyltransferase
VVEAYQHGIYPRSEEVVAATRGLERGRTSAEEVATAFKRAREELVEVQREAGLDYFSDGLLRWQDLFRPLVEATPGLEARTLVRWFDNNTFFRAPEVTGPIGRAGVPAVVEDGAEVPEPRVATLPSPYLFSRAAVTSADRDALMVELARSVLAPVVGALVGRGYRLVHLEEPWLPYFGIEDRSWGAFERALAEVREAAAGARVVLHTYFADASPHADLLRRLPVDAVGVDFVETDLDRLGRGWEVGLLAGVVDGRRSLLEPVDRTVEFVRRVAEALSPPFLLLSSTCELEYLPEGLARRKVLRLGEVARALKEAGL